MLSARAVRVGLYTKLVNTRAITDLVARRVYHAVAPAEAVFPLVVFHKQSGTPDDVFGGPAWVRQIWLVKCIADDTSSSVAEDVQAAIVDALTDDTVTVSGGTVFDLRYTSDLDYLETANGQQYRHHGALFRLTVV